MCIHIDKYLAEYVISAVDIVVRIGCLLLLLLGPRTVVIVVAFAHADISSLYRF